MLNRYFAVPVLLLATACAGTTVGGMDQEARRAAMRALPDQSTCRPAEPEGARHCTMRLGSKEVRVQQYRNLTTIRYRNSDTADSGFINDLRRVMTTAGTPNVERAIGVVTSHGRSGVMEEFTSGCFDESGSAPGPACFVMLTY